jgi:hypothetical protein
MDFDSPWTLQDTMSVVEGPDTRHSKQTKTRSQNIRITPAEYSHDSGWQAKCAATQRNCYALVY